MTALLLQFWPYIIAGLGLLFGAWKIDRNATNRERNKQAKAELDARSEGQKIDDAVAGRSGDENRERLGKWSRK